MNNYCDEELLGALKTNGGKIYKLRMEVMMLGKLH
jgi:hypothetical protein